MNRRNSVITIDVIILHTVITSKVLRHIRKDNKITVNIVYMFLYILESKGEKSHIVVLVYFSVEVKYLSVTVHVFSHDVQTLVLSAALSSYCSPKRVAVAVRTLQRRAAAESQKLEKS